MSVALHRYQVSTVVASVGASSEVHAIRLGTPSTRRIRIEEVEISTSGVDAAANPVRVKIIRGVTSGFSAGSSATPTEIDPAIPASLVTATTQMTGTPTGGTNVFDNRVAAPATLAVIPIPDNVQPIIAVSSFADITLTGGGTALTNVTVTVTWSE